MYKAITAFFSGGIDSSIPQFALLSISLFGTGAVAWGIVREEENKWSLTTILVVGGVAIEALCTFLLFGYDEGISQRQQRIIDRQQKTIVSLETALAPRTIDPDKSIDAIMPYAGLTRRVLIISCPDLEAYKLGAQINFILHKAGWPSVLAPYSNEIIFDGVAIEAPDWTTISRELDLKLRDAQKALVGYLALSKISAVESSARPKPYNPGTSYLYQDEMHILVGFKPMVLRPPNGAVNATMEAYNDGSGSVGVCRAPLVNR